MNESFKTYPVTQTLFKSLSITSWLTRFKPDSDSAPLSRERPAASRPAACIDIKLEEVIDIKLEEADAAHLLRAQLNLRWFNGSNRRMLTIVGTDNSQSADALMFRLAVASAYAGRKTLLVDANMREPMTAAWQTTQRASHGLAAVLAHTASPAESIVPAHVKGLSLLPAGTAVQSPDTLFARDDVRETLDSLAEGFDVVFIRTPPIGAYADALIMTECVGGALFVVERHRTSASRLKEAGSQLRSMDATIVGAVFTDI